ncbi:hypothetical protein Tco_0615636 [Tanacetum coccineum]
MREVVTPRFWVIPFSVYQSWFYRESFDKSLRFLGAISSSNDSNKINSYRKSFRHLKLQSIEWGCKDDINRSNVNCFSIKAWLSDLDKLFNNGLSNEDCCASERWMTWSCDVTLMRSRKRLGFETQKAPGYPRFDGFVEQLSHLCAMPDDAVFVLAMGVVSKNILTIVLLAAAKLLGVLLFFPLRSLSWCQGWDVSFSEKACDEILVKGLHPFGMRLIVFYMACSLLLFTSELGFQFNSFELISLKKNRPVEGGRRAASHLLVELLGLYLYLLPMIDGHGLSSDLWMDCLVSAKLLGFLKLKRNDTFFVVFPEGLLYVYVGWNDLENFFCFSGL